MGENFSSKNVKFVERDFPQLVVDGDKTSSRNDYFVQKKKEESRMVMVRLSHKIGIGK